MNLAVPTKAQLDRLIRHKRPDTAKRNPTRWGEERLRALLTIRYGRRPHLTVRQSNAARPRRLCPVVWAVRLYRTGQFQTLRQCCRFAVRNANSPRNKPRGRALNTATNRALREAQAMLASGWLDSRATEFEIGNWAKAKRRVKAAIEAMARAEEQAAQ